MNPAPRSCRYFEARLSESVDGELSDHDEAALREHLSACDRCEEVREGLRRVRNRAAAIEDRPPARDLWPGIADRIGASVPSAPAPGLRRSVGRGTGIGRSVPQLLAAGIVAVVALGVARAARPVVPVTEAAVPADPAVRLVTLPDVHTGYENAILDLVRLLDESRAVLDPRTVRVIEDNLAVIDEALAAARRALADDPESEFLQRHLERTARQKLHILQRVTTLAAAG